MASEPIAAPKRDVGLCLSGGGYRAAVFHLGSLIRLNEAGLLPRLRTVSSVSGGSIIAGLLGLRWTRLQIGPDGRAGNLGEVIIEPVLEFTGRGLDVAAVLTSAFVPGLISRRVEKRYRACSARPRGRPARPHRSGFRDHRHQPEHRRAVRFSRRGVGDFRRGRRQHDRVLPGADVPLSLAVAASSASRRSCRRASSTPQSTPLSRRPRTVYLTDGGISTIWVWSRWTTESHRIVLSSDGGATCKRSPGCQLVFWAGRARADGRRPPGGANCVDGSWSVGEPDQQPPRGGGRSKPASAEYVVGGRGTLRAARARSNGSEWGEGLAEHAGRPPTAAAARTRRDASPGDSRSTLINTRIIDGCVNASGRSRDPPSLIREWSASGIRFRISSSRCIAAINWACLTRKARDRRGFVQMIDTHGDLIQGIGDRGRVVDITPEAHAPFYSNTRSISSQISILIRGSSRHAAVEER